MTVTQNHTSAIYTIALCISRAADAEWVRACGCVSRFAPLIGRVGELRAYLEGGWLQNIPTFSTSFGYDQGETGASQNQNGERVDEMGVRVAQSSSGTDTESSAYYSSAPSLVTSTPATKPYAASTPTSMSSPPTPLTPPTSAGTSLPVRSKPMGVSVSGHPPSSYFPQTLEKLHTDSVRSIESLSSFPAPPTHFPLPNMPFPSSPLTQKLDRDSTETARPTTSSEIALHPPGQAVTERHITSSPLSISTENVSRDDDRDEREGDKDTLKALKPPDSPSISTTHRRQKSAQLGSSEPATQPQQRKTSGSSEFGRSESVLSTNSIVASMRDKWDRTVRPIYFFAFLFINFYLPRLRLLVAQDPNVNAQPSRERDIPRVPNKVADLASRYVSPENTGTGLGPPKPGSPTSDRARNGNGSASQGPSPISTPRQSLGHSPSTSMSQVPSTSASSHSMTSNTQVGPGAGPGQTKSEIDIMRRRKRLEELEDLDRREQAIALKAREREIEMRSQALQREGERIRAMNAAQPSNGPPPGRAMSIRQHAQHSYSMTNLAVPRSSADVDFTPAGQRPTTTYGDPSAVPPQMSASQSSSSDSSTQYRNSTARPRTHSGTNIPNINNQFSHIQVIPNPMPQKEKNKGGWMRRLSMPAFSSESKKIPVSGSPYALGTGIAGGPGTTPSSGAGAGVGNGYNAGSGLQGFEHDATGGIGHVIARPRKLSIGRR